MLWASELSEGLAISSNSRHITCIQQQQGFARAGAITFAPTTDITFRIQTGPVSIGGVYVGLISPRIFELNRWLARGDGAYCLRPGLGWLVGSGQDRKSYCSTFASGVVRCLYDHEDQTIRYIVNGVDCGAAFTCAEPDLHGVAFLFHERDSIEIESGSTMALPWLVRAP